MIACTSVLASTLSMRAFSTLRILPRIGRIAWTRGSRPCRAEPPAESPSTMKTSHSAGLVDWQSDSLPGRPPPPSRPLRDCGPGRAPCARRSGRSPRPATCGRCRVPSAGFCSSQAPSWSLTIRCTKPLASVLPSLVLVWPSNCGSPSLIEMIAVRPSRMSSPETRSSRFLIRPHSSPQWLTREVSAARKPSSWVPPSWVLMVLAKVCTDSVNEVFHCIATSRLMWFSEALGRLGLEGDDGRVGLVLAAVEVLDVVDQAAVVLEDLLDAAALAAL